MALAKPADVEACLLRPLTKAETTYVGVLLERVEAMIRSRVDLDGVKAGTNQASLVVHVEAEAVARVFRNPEGRTQEADGQYSYSVSTLVASGLLGLTSRDWELLGVGGGGWATIAPECDGYVKSRRRGGNPVEEFGYNIVPHRVAPDSVAPSWEVGP